MGIIQKAGQFKNSTLVIGLPADGKTTAIMREIESKDYNPLWIVFSNANAVIAQHPEWDMAVIQNWYAINNLYNEMRSGKIDISQYDVVAIEGLGYAATMALIDALAKSDTKDPRPSYLAMGRELPAMLAGLRDLFGAVFVTLDLHKDEENNIEMSINPHLYNSIIGMFGEKWYAYSEPNADKTAVNYIVQDNPTFALRFKPTVRKGE